MGRESSNAHLQIAFSGTQLQLSAPHLSVILGAMYRHCLASRPFSFFKLARKDKWVFHLLMVPSASRSFIATGAVWRRKDRRRFEYV